MKVEISLSPKAWVTIQMRAMLILIWIQRLMLQEGFQSQQGKKRLGTVVFVNTLWEAWKTQILPKESTAVLNLPRRKGYAVRKKMQHSTHHDNLQKSLSHKNRDDMGETTFKSHQTFCKLHVVIYIYNILMITHHHEKCARLFFTCGAE
mmetsp:Transcript_13739/g.16603  ORF Transcript_13739/g.16603 Transcript_13739/m.16603 type:complete len:149 (+) Transcript_13739:680-1126(+)